MNAKDAGFDGVELHGANGYLLDQFLRDGANHRTDAYGGSIENRARLALEATDAVIGVWGPSRVGYKISPYFSNLGMSDSAPIETFSYLAKELGSRRIAYLHIAEAVAGPAVAPAGTLRATPILRRFFGGPVIANGGYNLESANAAVASNEVDLVAFGVPFLANPDLTERWRRGAPLNAPQFDLFYTGEETGIHRLPDARAAGHGLKAPGATPGRFAGGSETVRMSSGSFPDSTGIGRSASILNGREATTSSGRSDSTLTDRRSHDGHGNQRLLSGRPFNAANDDGRGLGSLSQHLHAGVVDGDPTKFQRDDGQDQLRVTVDGHDGLHYLR